MPHKTISQRHIQEYGYVFLLALLSAIVLSFPARAEVLNNFVSFLSGSVRVDVQALSETENSDIYSSLLDASALKEFYSSRQNEAFWMSSTGIYSKGEKMFKTIEESWTHGLNPETYHYSDIKGLLNDQNAQAKQNLDILLSDAFVRYVADLSGMRVSGKVFGLDEDEWKKSIPAAQALQMLADSGLDIEDELRGVEPQGQTYAFMRKELMRLVNARPKNEKEHLLPISLSGVLRPGYGHDAVPLLREYFGLPKVETNNWATYDDDLAAAVISFQRSNGLKADGVIGPSTMSVINQGNTQKIEQLVVNMERLRWDDVTTRGDRYVVVNIPSAMLWAIDDGKVAFEMPVVVGKPERATQAFKTVITGIRLNPDWTVPPTIKAKDILPKLVEDPEFYSVVGMRMMSGYGPDAYEIDPYTVDWANITSSELHSIRMVQSPGINNPLGFYRVIMPNPYNIYLHDTTRPELFSENYRALSSGCVRIRDPKKMTEFILQDMSGWSGSRIDRIIESRKKMDVMIEEPIPVSLLYYTTWVNESGAVEYGQDVYGYDKKLLSELQKIDGYYNFTHNNKMVSVSEVQEMPAGE